MTKRVVDMHKKQPVKWLMKKSRKENVKLVALIIANALFSALSIVFAFLIKEIIDSATIHKDQQRLISFGVAIIGVVVLQFLFRIVTNGLSEHIKGKLEMAYKTDAFNGILNKKHEKITGYHSGEILTRLTSDVAIISDGMATIIPTVVSALTRLICAVVALVILDWIFAVAFTVAGILVFITITLLKGKLKSLHKETQETDGKVRSFMQECLENLLAVKVFSVNNKIENQSEKLQSDNFKVKMKRKNYSVVGNAIYNFIFSAGYLFALIYGGVRILGGILTYGALSAILQLVNNVQVPFASLSNILPKYYAMIASAERLMEIEEIEDEEKCDVIDRQKLYDELKGISVENVTFTYDRDKILNGASVYVNKGDSVAIVGTSGAGKSTLIKLMLGVYATDEGGVYFDTENGRVDLDSNTRAMFSYVPQGNMLFSGTIRDNVTFIKSDATEEEINKAIEIACADEFINILPKGLDTVVGENGVGLSEGQIQRVAIARAVLVGAPIMLLDEATSALDERTEQKVLNNLSQIEGATLFVISHKKAVYSICNRVISISGKKIKEISK